MESHSRAQCGNLFCVERMGVPTFRAIAHFAQERVARARVTELGEGVFIMREIENHHRVMFVHQRGEIARVDRDTFVVSHKADAKSYVGT